MARNLFDTATDREPIDTEGSILRYLGVIHFGRGRGDFVEIEAPSFWLEQMKDSLNAYTDFIARLWPALRGHRLRRR